VLDSLVCEVGSYAPDRFARTATAFLNRVGKEAHMSWFSKRILLICEECGERIILAGTEEAWRSEPTPFGCRCGETVLNRLGQDAPLSNRVTGAPATT